MIKNAQGQNWAFNELQDLRTSERLHRLIFKHTQDLITIHKKKDLSYEYVNPAVVETLGFNLEELLLCSPFDFIHPQDIVRAAAIYKQSMPADSGPQELRHRKKNGSYIWLELIVIDTPSLDEDNFIIVISRDITERKEAEAAMLQAYDEPELKVRERPPQLHQQLNPKIDEIEHWQQKLRICENHYRTVFESSHHAAVIIDTDLKIVDANAKMQMLTGYSHKELIGANSCQLLVAPAYLPVVEANYRLRRINPAKAPQDYEIEGIGRQGLIRNIIINVANVPDSKHILVSLQDVTAKKKAEALLETDRERFYYLFSNMVEGVVLYEIIRDANDQPSSYTILDANPGFEKMTGIRREDAIGKTALDLSGFSELHLKEDYMEVVRTGTTIYRDIYFQQCNKYFEVWIIPWGLNGFATIYSDITTRKKAEIALERQVASQALLLEISKNFNNIVTYNTDAMINMTLKMIGEFDNSDRSYVFLASADGTAISNTHEWCAEGVQSHLESLQDLPRNAWRWASEKFRKGEYFYFPRVDDMPPEAWMEKEQLQSQGVKSLIAVPMLVEDKVIGFVGFDSVRRERIWTHESIIILDSVAQSIAKALERKKNALALESSEHIYRTIFENTGAATFISEADMSISMVNERFLKLLGYQREEVIGMKWTQFVSPRLAEQMETYHHMRRLDYTKSPREYKTQLVDKEGNILDGLNVVDLIPGTKSSAQTFVNLTDYNRIDRALKAIRAVNQVMVHASNERNLLKDVCKKIVEVGGYSLAWVGYIQDDPQNKIKPVAHAGNDFGFLSKLNISLTDPKRGRGPSGNAIRSGQPVILRNFKNEPSFAPWVKNALRRGFKSGITMPLKDGNRALGVISIYADEVEFFDREEEKLIAAMAADLSYAITFHRAHERYNVATRELGTSLEKMQRIIMQAVSALGAILDVSDPYTSGHQKKVMRLTAAIAEELGITREQMEGIKVAANLHDIGKIYIPSQILNKPGKLSALEFEMIKTHSQTGYEIIKDIEFPWPVAETILQHHERIDGSGYPRNLLGEEILLEARILAVADVVEAMASHRPYRPALGIDVALDEICSNRGKLYDPDVVDACLMLFQHKGFTF